MPATKEKTAFDFDNTLVHTIDAVVELRNSMPTLILKNVLFTIPDVLHIGKHRIERVVVEKGDSIEFNKEIMRFIGSSPNEFYIVTMNGETEAIRDLLERKKIAMEVVKSSDSIKSNAKILVDDSIWTVLKRAKRGLQSVLWVNDFNCIFAPVLRHMGVPTASNAEELSAALTELKRQKS